MDGRELKKIRRLSEAILAQTARIEELRLAAYGQHTMDTVGGSRAAPENKIEKLCIEIVREEGKLDALIDKRKDLIDNAFTEIMESVEDKKQRHILYLRYIAVNRQGHSLEWTEVIEIAHRVHNIQRSRVFELHNLALKNLKQHNI